MVGTRNLRRTSALILAESKVMLLLSEMGKMANHFHVRKRNRLPLFVDEALPC